MNIDSIIWLMTAYVFLYYAVARHALSQLSKADSGYVGGEPGGDLRVGMQTSLAIVEMIFDTDLPSSDYGSVFRYELYAARGMLIMFLPILVLLFYFADAA